MVIWFIGKSGAGKSAIGNRLYTILKKEISNLIYLDGDQFRDAISWDLGYSIEERHISEKRRSNLCKLLSDQGISIICAALSNAPDLREWNRNNIKDYFEIYIKVNRSTLLNRDKKDIYKQYNRKKINNVVGEDIPFHEPKYPLITINNNGDENSFDEIISNILLAMKKEEILT